MKRNFKRALGLVLATGSITLGSWVGNPDTALPQLGLKDTIPSLNSKQERDFDQELRQIADARKSLEKAIQVDMVKAMKDMDQAIKDLDLHRIEADAQKAVAELDLQKMEMNLKDALQNLDKELEKKDADKQLSSKDKLEIRKELEQTRQEIRREMEQLKKELTRERSSQKINIDKELAAARKELEQAKKDLQSNRFDMEKEIKQAHVELDKASKQVGGYQEMVYAMESEGLLNTSTDYRIEKKNNKLLVNGKELNASQQERYEKYMEDKEIIIEKQKGSMSIKNEKDRN